MFRALCVLLLVVASSLGTTTNLNCCSDMPQVIASLKAQIARLDKEVSLLKEQVTKKGCDIYLKSWGYVDTGPDTGLCQMSINGVASFSSFKTDSNRAAYRGFNLMTVDLNTCKAGPVTSYDTHAYKDQAVRLNNYLQGLPTGTTVVGVICDSGNENGVLDPAKATFKSLGVNADNVSLRTKLAFITTKGSPSKTVQLSAASGGPSLELRATVTA